ncbi:unnamed protein product [Amoebophrya sp. A25]|nr:unnamed protein product [Amoebophrya sp. A25]|eukprot:GSA25T00019377001.1
MIYSRLFELPHRSMTRMEAIRAQKAEKELQECTFQPNLNRVLNRHILHSRPENYEQTLVMQEEERQKRMEDLDQYLYRECTHRPRISQYAKKHGGGHSHRVDGDFSRGSNVYDRLYSAYTIAQTARSGLLERVADEERKKADSPIQAKAANKKALAAAELLYSDALERRERQKERANDFYSNIQDTTSAEGAVKSRRYYWALLEKQVRDAFDGAVKQRKKEGRMASVDDPHQPQGEVLYFADLPVFLDAMGCMSANTRSESDAKLKLSLWRYLDPDAQGATDLLSLTVFFHVLMGAVDDRTFRSIRMDAKKEDRDQTGTKIRNLAGRYEPSKLRAEFHALYFNRLHHQKLKHQEHERERNSPRGRGDNSPDGRNLDGKEKEARSRSVGPTQKRTHNQAVLSEKVTRRLQAESGLMTHVDLLLWRQQKNQEKREEERRKQERKAQRECTFKPKLVAKTFTSHATTRYPNAVSKGDQSNLKTTTLTSGIGGSGGVQGQMTGARGQGRAPAKNNVPQQEATLANETDADAYFPAGSGRRYHELYDRGMATKERHRRSLQQAAAAREREELKACTFKPDMQSSSVSFKRNLDHDISGARASPTAATSGTTPTPGTTRWTTPRGYAKVTSRLRRGREEEEVRRRYRDDRTCSVAQQKPSRARLQSPGDTDMYYSDRPGRLMEEPHQEDDVLLYVDVNITPTQAERLVLYRGETCGEAAAAFADKHQLSEKLRKKLHYLLTAQLENLNK